MESTSTLEQLCMACNRWHPSYVFSCQCGHVLKDSIKRFNTSSGKDSRYRTRNSTRAGSLSSESTLTSSPSPQDTRRFTYSDKAYSPDVLQKANPRSPSSFQQNSPNQCNHKENHTKKIDKRKKFPRVIYRCKSYKKAKPTELNFQFDFSMFDSRAPNYPSALEDINARILRQNTLKRMLDSCR